MNKPPILLNTLFLLDSCPKLNYCVIWIYPRRVICGKSLRPLIELHDLNGLDNRVILRIFPDSATLHLPGYINDFEIEASLLKADLKINDLNNLAKVLIPKLENFTEHYVGTYQRRVQ